jgi:hypothetical protein
MPRRITVQYPGAIYHVMSRVYRREDIFLDDVDEELGWLGWQAAVLVCRRKSDAAKLAITVRLRRETRLPVKATIASRIHLGTSKSANACLHAATRETAPAQPAQGPWNMKETHHRIG